MSKSGVFAVARSIWDDADFAPEPFTQREAFIWLVSEAAWKDFRGRDNHGKPLDLKRSEFSFSIRFLADKWGWSRQAVHRFMGKLLDRGIIGRTTTGQQPDNNRDTKRDTTQIYFIKNYNKFQTVGLPKRDTQRDSSGTAAGQQRDKQEEGETLKKGKERNARERASSSSKVRSELMTVLDAERAEAIIEHRKRMKPALNERAARLLAARLKQFPNPNAAADEMIVRGWKSISPDWFKENEKPGSSGGGTELPKWQGPDGNSNSDPPRHSLPALH